MGLQKPGFEIAFGAEQGAWLLGMAGTEGHPSCGSPDTALGATMLPRLPASTHTTVRSTGSFQSQPGDMSGINQVTISRCLMQFLMTVMHRCAFFHQLNSQENKVNSGDLGKGSFAFAMSVRACRAASWSRTCISPWELPLVHQHGPGGRVRPQ